MSEEQHNDEETERLLAEMEEREQLEKEAIDLGVEFRSNISTEKLKERVEAAKSEPEVEEPTDDEIGAVLFEGTENETPEPYHRDDDQPVEIDTVTNVSNNPRQIGGKVVAIGDSYTLTKMDKQNERLMAKLHRAIKLGLLEVEG